MTLVTGCTKAIVILRWPVRGDEILRGKTTTVFGLGCGFLLGGIL
jgi:hypothetical protein